MAIRQARLLTKNSNIEGRSLPTGSNIKLGEAVVNLSEGILYFSGDSATSPSFTPSNNDASYFEVGSNLYDLKIRNRIVGYEGITDVSGKFLSGTTSGFTLADISSIGGIDSYVTGGTYDNTVETITLGLNGSKPNVNITGISDYYTTGVTFDGSLAHFDRNDTLSAYTLDLSSFASTADTYTTAFTYNDANELTINRNQGQGDLSVIIDTMTGLTVNGILTAETLNSSAILSGGTNLNNIFSQNDFFTTGGTLINNTIFYDRNDILSAYTVDLSSLVTTDTFVTGYTYNSTNNTFTITLNDATTIDTQILELSGVTLSNLTTGRVVYIGAGGELVDTAGFTYNDSTNTLSSENLDSTNNLTVGGDAIIQGSLTVFGPSVSALTSELYVEDPNITLNYNPTGNTNVTSIGAGWTIQDGDGVGGDTNIEIVRTQNLTGLTPTEIPNITEYTGPTGNENRALITQLNDIIIRSTDVSDDGTTGSITGVRVLSEFDFLDGGQY